MGEQVTSEDVAEEMRFEVVILSGAERVVEGLPSEACLHLGALFQYHFMRLFKEETGESVHAYVRQRKLLNAARLIREGMKTTEAAELNGFQDYSVFYRAFKETFGTAPGQLK